MEQLRATTDNALPLLPKAGQVPGHIDKHDERHGEGIAHPDETGGLLGARGVKASAESHRVVRDDAGRAPAEAAEADDDVRGPALVQLDEGALVDERLNDGVDVVGTSCRLRHERPEVDVSDGVDVEGALMAEERG